MAEYIEREALKYETWTTWPLCEQITVVRKKTIESIPAADVAPVRHGRWEHHYHDSGSPIDDKWYCSECNMCNGHKRTWYCPNCGAKMDLEAQT